MLKNLSRSLVAVAVASSSVACGGPPPAAVPLTTTPPAAVASAPAASAQDRDKEKAKPNQFWWPDQLDLSPLRQHAAQSS
ncbi:MAG TPA: hypothetical protein VLT33_10910, partial [Labilithrix sp.]|nr:hypothetical protein [Labilithrix sp.]